MLDIIQLVKTELVKETEKSKERSAVSDYGYSFGKLCRGTPP